MSKVYCLDTNVFIQAWNSYYAMDVMPEYWDTLDRMAHEGVVFCTIEVKREIERIDDDLCQWIKVRRHFFREIDKRVQIEVRRVLKAFPRLVDSIRDRSMADPWVIAHALSEGATVVTKEQATGSSKRIRIPDVCTHFNLPCVDDFDFVREAGIRFSAERPSGSKRRQMWLNLGM